MSKKEELARKYRLKAKLNTEMYLEDGSNIEKAYIAGWDAACEDADGVRGHIKLWKEEFLDKACEWLYAYNQQQAKRGAKAVLSIKEFTVNVEDFKKYMEE